jgi:surfactin synthase thioesterase subunit
MITVFAVPFAGGYKYSYQQLEREETAGFRLHVLELPGRGLRSEEDLLLSVEAMAVDILHQIRAINNGSFALMGHSLGALICWYATRKLFKESSMMPLHLFLSGCPSPSIPLPVINRHLLPRSEFLQSIESMDEMPSSILQNEELMDYFEPVLRADFTALETFVYPGPVKLPVPVTLINGTLDREITPTSIEGWGKETEHKVSVHFIEGAHFYLLEKQKEFVSIIADALQAPVKNPKGSAA